MAKVGLERLFEMCPRALLFHESAASVGVGPLTTY